MEGGMSSLILPILALAVVGYFIFRESGGYGSRVKKRMERLKAPPVKAKSPIVEANLRRDLLDTSLPMMNRLIQLMPSLVKLRERLERAGLEKTSIERYLLICAMIFAFSAMLMMLAFGTSPMIAVLVSFVLGFGFPHIYTGMRASKRMRMFLVQFPDALDLIVRGLRSGLPVPESMQMVSKELPQPVASTFGDICDAMRLGVPFEKALLDMGLKLRLTEFNFFMTSIVLQRETGGNLSEILNNLSETLRMRITMRLKIKALSSEARASAYIVGALPFFTTGALWVIAPEYLGPLFNDYRGNISLMGAFASLGTGVGIMMRMAKMEI